MRCVVKFVLRTVRFRFYWLFGLVTVSYSVVAGEQQLVNARILDVHPELPVVIVDVGRQHGGRVGMPYVVIQEEIVVAKLRLYDVRSYVSGAVVERLESGAKISGSDRIQIINTRTIW